ncbi:MAG TPA: YMGG-like glycine zipper-containing protein [Candidatus Sulfotelmatobacter sp.]|nr:YMGG-like glycine zipper-containing protein [Candidatus Sulfotelmatobacter sp.]
MLSKLAVVGLLAVALAGCDHMSNSEQRTLSGGAIGAGGGAVLGAVAGFNPLVGAAVGGAAGAVVGAATSHHN